ncbi:SPOR domain-containing protein [Thiohalobacter sp. IOR34]|uniref:SPOR domain-containing protein n=1 Tax=Thiohalobacter sp. IOR34 TaxID=3057176 RepID=UPI0025AFEAFE|nr:SPOR domain-containing protein [Thiohalobacter sp. IOR34]WJW75982.1 SPOR domain-containing protein [Thiohalobacter sp. IOR34]
MYPGCETLRSILLLLLGGLLAAASPSLPAVDDFERGVLALEAGDPERALQLWQPLAEKGDPNARFGLGMLYFEGVVVEQSFEEANYWFLLAAEQGFAPAQYNLGNSYRNGRGLPGDPGMAVYWWRKAAEQAFPPAQYNLATALRFGSGVDKDMDQALHWYREAAAKGHPLAQAVLEKLAAPPEPTAIRPTGKPEASGNADCRSWLKTAAATDYAIQLMASHQRRSIDAFLHRHPLPSPGIVCSYNSRGQSWHALLLGPYPDRQRAERARRALPAGVLEGKPYLRRIGSLRRRVLQPSEPAAAE